MNRTVRDMTLKRKKTPWLELWERRSKLDYNPVKMSQIVGCPICLSAEVGRYVVWDN
jgi:hypothetical protein